MTLDTALPLGVDELTRPRGLVLVVRESAGCPWAVAR